MQSIDMPRPITIFLNTDQSRKTVFLLPDNDPDVKSRIIKEAQNKFRVKGINTVYLPGGVILEDNAFPPTASSCFVGKGEPFVGRAAGSSSNATRQPAEVRLFAQESYIDEKAIAQMQAVAGLEGVLGVCGMPDLHPGDRFPIGCTMIAEGIYPALIGSDIGCGIALYELSSKRLRLANQPKKLAERLRGLDDPWEGSAAEWLQRYGLEHHDRWREFDQSLGTIGLGNHFVEICSVESIAGQAIATELGIAEDSLYLMGDNFTILFCLILLTMFKYTLAREVSVLRSWPTHARPNTIHISDRIRPNLLISRRPRICCQMGNGESRPPRTASFGVSPPCLRSTGTRHRRECGRRHLAEDFGRHAQFGDACGSRTGGCSAEGDVDTSEGGRACARSRSLCRKSWSMQLAF